MAKKKTTPEEYAGPSPYSIQADKMEVLRGKIAEAKKGFNFTELDNSQLGLVLAMLVEGVDRCFTIREFRNAINLLKGDHERVTTRSDRYLVIDLHNQIIPPKAC